MELAPTNHGCTSVGSSTISHRFSVGVRAETTIPAASSCATLVVVDLVAVAVTLGHGIAVETFAPACAGLDQAGLGAGRMVPPRSDSSLRFSVLPGVLPFGDQADQRVRPSASRTRCCCALEGQRRRRALIRSRRAACRGQMPSGNTCARGRGSRRSCLRYRACRSRRAPSRRPFSCPARRNPSLGLFRIGSGS